MAFGNYPNSSHVNTNEYTRREPQANWVPAAAAIPRGGSVIGHD